MSYQFIKINESEGGQVGEIQLTQPPANIFTAVVMGEIRKALQELQNSPRRKLITISGEGKHFSFGASVEEHLPERVNDMLPGFHELIGDILKCQVPTMAKVRGMCLGGGFEVAMACTFIIAEESAKFAVPEVQLSVFPPVACALLPIKLSGAIASEIILSGEQWGAEKLRAYGFVNSVCESGNLDEEAEDFFKKYFEKKSAMALRMAHRASQEFIVEQYEKLIGRLEKLYLQDLMSTKDAVEGITAFVEKRKPQWVDA